MNNHFNTPSIILNNKIYNVQSLIYSLYWNPNFSITFNITSSTFPFILKSAKLSKGVGYKLTITSLLPFLLALIGSRQAGLTCRLLPRQIIKSDYREW
jgi:hypothetical protein